MTQNTPFISSKLFDTETDQVRDMLEHIQWDAHRAERVKVKTNDFIKTIRNVPSGSSEIETFLQHYPLSSAEGRALMTLAEALLRIPDVETADKLIAEKIGVSDWKRIGGSGFFGAASSFGLGLAKSMLGGMLSSVSKPVIRKATTETVRRLGAQFVVSEIIKPALKMAEKETKSGYRMSFDMLGEGARTIDDAERYFQTYVEAAHTIGDYNNSSLPLENRHGMSVKLSALHPRYTWTQAEDCIPEIADKLLYLSKIAAKKGMTLTVDAEESERLEISLEIFARVATSPDLKGWNGFGLAVLAYDRRCHDVIDYISNLARQSGRIIQIRLAKGAYWDGEVKRAQVSGWDQYPVFTRKINTDLSYLLAAQKMLAARAVIRPMFATHNAGTAAAILELAGSDRSGFEFQRLFGMGQHLGDILRLSENIPVTYYAPVGSYEDLLPYLVRRMLENGANTSFVSQIRDASIPIEKLGRDIVSAAKDLIEKPLPLSLPRDIYGERQNSKGYDLSRILERKTLLAQIVPSHLRGEGQGEGENIREGDIDIVFKTAQKSFSEWNETPAKTRAVILQKTADLLEGNTGALIGLLQTEAKKTLFDAIAEIREAVDFCRYYAAEGEKAFGEEGQLLKGPTGEINILKLSGRGVFVAISPWNFPLAIFLGQVSAALMAGNTVIAKPAEQTPKIAEFAVDILYRAGVPKSVLFLILGDGQIGSKLVAHKDVAGVVFTGSTEVARSINRTLASKNSAIVPLIAETGGLNAMIVDSTALPEQVVDDVLLSAFGSAGQRCSALRVLYLQNNIADKVIHLLKGALPLLKMGRADDVATDIPPVIDAEALENLKAHQIYLNGFAKLIAAAKLPDKNDDTYFAPCAYEIDSLTRLKGEVFGPILHVIRFNDIQKTIDEINATGYGLTFGFHSRLTERHKMVASSVRAGNIYINRNIIGAVVGVQPFGGQGLSGTGPKAGGPHYLQRFATEITVTDNIMATGGNIDLLATLEE